MSHFLPTKTYATIHVKWFMPHTEPPEGKARVIWAACIPWPFAGDYRDVIPCTRCERKRCGYTVSMACGGDTRPIRMHSPEAKAKRRRDNLRKRIMKKAPLFLDQLMQREIAKNPDYYNPAAIARQPTTADIIADIEAESDAAMTAQFRR